MNHVLEPPDDRPAGAGPAVDRPVDSPPVADQAVVAAFSAFYREQVSGVVAFLLYLGARLPDATDLAQETMIDLYRSWSKVDHPKAWARRVASRKFGRRLAEVEDPADLGDGTPLLRAEHNITEWEQRHEIVRLLRELPWRQRQVAAWTFDGYSAPEIAAELGITAEAVRSNLKLARRTLAGRVASPGGGRDE